MVTSGGTSPNVGRKPMSEAICGTGNELPPPTQRENKGLWVGFSGSPSEGFNPYEGLTEEEKEDMIAENIFEWWISGKSYAKWYAEKFLQQKLDFGE